MLANRQEKRGRARADVHATRRMASVVRPATGLPVLELGAGTGIIAKAILEPGVKPQRLVSVGYSKDFYRA